MYALYRSTLARVTVMHIFFLFVFRCKFIYAFLAFFCRCECCALQCKQKLDMQRCIRNSYRSKRKKYTVTMTSGFPYERLSLWKLTWICHHRTATIKWKLTSAQPKDPVLPNAYKIASIFLTSSLFICLFHATKHFHIVRLHTICTVGSSNISNAHITRFGM